MTPRKKFYLAHNFGSRFKVRDYITPILSKIYDDYDIVNPFMVGERYNEGLYDYKGSSEKEINDLFSYNIDRRNENIVESDLKHIDKCNMLVSYIERPSVGTSMEIIYAKRERKIPVVLVFDTDIDISFHPWLNYYSDQIIFLDELGIYPLTNGVKLDQKVLQAFQKYGNEIAHLLAVKNVAYKKSASGLSYTGVIKRINEKTIRETNLLIQDLDGNDGESLRETLVDIPGYGIIQLMCHDKAFPFENGFEDQTLLGCFSNEDLLLEIRKRGL